jgi:MtaA/CmuA family methyltransferase
MNRTVPVMTGLERTLAFIRGEPVDRPPFHPIIMRWAAAYAGIPYARFCLDSQSKCDGMIRCAEDFDLDWVTVMSDPFCEAEAFGLAVEYPANDLPVDVGGHLNSLEAAAALRHYRPQEHRRTRSRIDEIREFKRRCGDRYFIVGWVEGPVAEYADIRGVSEAAMDFMDDPETVSKAMDVIVESALEFIRLQVEAGAHCIGIGDAFCSQIGPRLYRNHAFERERRMVDYIHSLGALAKLHICGNTAAIQADMIRTGADIVDVDHLVPDMGCNVALLGPRQVFSGKPDPVSVVQNGPLELLAAQTRECHALTGGRCIVSAGCEITPGTTVERMREYRALCDHLA